MSPPTSGASLSNRVSSAPPGASQRAAPGALPRCTNSSSASPPGACADRDLPRWHGGAPDRDTGEFHSTPSASFTIAAIGRQLRAPAARRREMTDGPAPTPPVTPPIPIPKVEELFQHIPHPRIEQRKHEKPVKIDDERVGINGKVALIITAVVGTMWCAYIFTVLALISLPSALGSGQAIVIVAWIAQTFIQLV